jgi:hemerythrin superfamily protein
MATTSLKGLMEHHKALDALLLEHQEALVGLEIERARERFETFREALLAHMRHEDERILPRYALLPRVRGGGVELFSGEHRKIRELLDEVSGLVRALDRRAPSARREVVHAFDRTALLKGLLEHHDLREGQILYPRLDEATSEEEKRALLEGVPEPPG